MLPVSFLIRRLRTVEPKVRSVIWSVDFKNLRSQTRLIRRHLELRKLWGRMEAAGITLVFLSIGGRHRSIFPNNSIWKIRALKIVSFSRTKGTEDREQERKRNLGRREFHLDFAVNPINEEKESLPYWSRITHSHNRKDACLAGFASILRVEGRRSPETRQWSGHCLHRSRNTRCSKQQDWLRERKRERAERLGERSRRRGLENLFSSL